MIKTVFKVEGMSCEHCVKTITKAVGGLDGVAGVSADLRAGTVSVEHDINKADAERIRAEIIEQGYDVI